MIGQDILPVVDDVETEGYWSAAADGRLVVKACLDCDSWLHLPREYCSRCGSWNSGWRDVGTGGTIYTWTTVYHQIHHSFPVPYTIVLVELDDAPGVRLLGNVAGAPKITPGMALVVHFEDRSGVAVPQWAPRDGWEYSSTAEGRQ